MKIQSIRNYCTTFYKNNNSRNFNTTNTVSDIFINSKNIDKKSVALQKTDIVSFKSKQYSSDSIVNPTNHCAYCGCKVYNETQLEDIAKEMLLLKGARLEGKIKSVLEKLSDAKHSQDIAVAKRLENKKQIEFFENLLDSTAKRPYLKGEDLFEQVYKINSEQAHKKLTENLHPLLKTIDHVSPQREDKENNNSDINLVEACSCCNHDLKKGTAFHEFYAMFPTIKNNMPKEKFDYAMSSVLDSSQNQILQRLSALNMLKFLERLFVQRTEAKNELDSVDYRIKGCKTGIENSIANCRQEIEDKTKEKDDLIARFEELKQNPEYVAMLRRSDIQTKLTNINTFLGSLRSRRSRLTESLNSLKSPTKKKNKAKSQITDEEKKDKIAQLTSDLQTIAAQIEEQENLKFNTELDLEELNNEFPPVEEYSRKKSKTDSIINAYYNIETETKQLEERKIAKSEIEQKEEELQQQINLLSKKSEDFQIDSYTKEEKEQYRHYMDLLEAISFIDSHPNGGNVRIIINSMAREPIEREIEELEKTDVIIDYNNNQKRKGLVKELEKVQKNKTDITYLINQSEKAIKVSKRLTEEMSLEEARQISDSLSEKIKQLNELQNFIKIPQLISQTSKEILLLAQTIEDLNNQQQKIESAYTDT